VEQPLRPKEQKVDFLLFLIVSALILIGGVMVYSSSSAIADGNDKFSGHAFFLKRQLVWLIVAYIAMFLATRVNIDNVRWMIAPALFASFALLLIVFLMPKVRETHRWISLGPITLQPSELFK
jgi:cell division protein FtsW